MLLRHQRIFLVAAGLYSALAPLYGGNSALDEACANELTNLTTRARAQRPFGNRLACILAEADPDKEIIHL